MMSIDPRESESQALKAQKAGNFAEAAAIWIDVLKTYPRWEDGYAHYYLADCLTRIGDIEGALQAYRGAIELSPNNDMFSSALDSLVEAHQGGKI